MNFSRTASMFPPSPVYTPTGAPGSSIYEHRIPPNSNTTTINNNNTTTTNTHSEDIELAQTNPTNSAPEISKPPRKQWTLKQHLCAALLLLSTLILLTYVGGCILTRLKNYNNRDHEVLFRAECEATGGSVVVHKCGVSGWGVSSVDCKHERTEGRKTDLATELLTRTRSLDMLEGGVYELGSYGYSVRYREVMGPGLGGGFSL
jgi:hypothetical protein